MNLLEKRKTMAKIRYDATNENNELVSKAIYLLPEDSISIALNVDIDIPGFKGKITKTIKLTLESLV
jgi:hypothetical protein